MIRVQWATCARGGIRSRLFRALFVVCGSLIAHALTSSAALALPAFPGAQGFGAIATGGRGGRVIKVTNLNTSGPGSLQAAVDTAGPRIIVFDVSGVIRGDVLVSQGDVTIAGQTAPGAGITIAGRLMGRYNTAVGNIIVRHLRVRPPVRPSNIPGNQYDAIQFSRNSRLILDHISVSWGLDENIDVYEAQDVTVQWSTIEQAARVGHPDGTDHNYGLINGPDGRRISVHHNLFAHNKNRNPAIANGPAEVRNNVAYNVRHGFVHHNSASGSIVLAGNYYRQGPNDTLFPFFFDGGSSAGLSYFMSDNFVDDPGDCDMSVNNPWQLPYQHSTFRSIGVAATLLASTEFNFAGATPGYVPVTAQGSRDAYASVLGQSGAFPRDTVTRRIMNEVTARTGSWDTPRPSDLLEGLVPGGAASDGDGDGMPDAWESTRGLNPGDAGDAAKVMASGYTAIEEYINEQADQLVSGAPGTPPPPAATPPAPTPPTATPPAATPPAPTPPAATPPAPMSPDANSPAPPAPTPDAGGTPTPRPAVPAVPVDMGGAVPMVPIDVTGVPSCAMGGGGGPQGLILFGVGLLVTNLVRRRRRTP